MLKKNYSSTKKFCRVTFRVPAEYNAKSAMLCGEFNDWNQTDRPMRNLKDGAFSATVSLEADKAYRFRYFLDGERWENDDSADEYWPNEHGSDDSVVKL